MCVGWTPLLAVREAACLLLLCAARASGSEGYAPVARSFACMTHSIAIVCIISIAVDRPPAAPRSHLGPHLPSHPNNPCTHLRTNPHAPEP